jgi:hypothetical protein
MSNIGHFQSALASFRTDSDWQSFKDANHIKGKDLARALSGFSEEFARLPLLSERDRAEFFSSRLPRIIEGVTARAEETADLNPVQRMLASLGGRTAEKKEEEARALRISHGQLSEGLEALNPTTWTEETLPRGPAFTTTFSELKADVDQAKRDISGRGVYFLYDGATGAWTQINNKVSAYKTTDQAYEEIVAQLKAAGASDEGIATAFAVANQGTLNAISLDLVGSRGEQLSKMTSAAYFHCEADGRVKVRIEAQGTLTKLGSSKDAVGEEVKIIGLYDPSHDAATVKLKLYT